MARTQPLGFSNNLGKEGILVEHCGEFGDALAARLDVVNSGPRTARAPGGTR